MFSLTSLDVHYLVREVRPLIIESFVDKIYQSKENKGQFLIRMRNPKHGKQQLFITVPEAFFLTTHRYEWPVSPSGFCMQLRKHLHNTQLVSIEQHGFERIVELTFKKGDIEWKIVIELFSKGNVVLVNNEGLIRGVMDLQRWKDRTLRVNAPYEYPPSVTNTLALTQDHLEQLYDNRELVKFCATTLALGGKYAEDFLSHLEVDKHQKSLPQGLIFSLQKYLHQELVPVIHGEDTAPFPLSGWTDTPCESFSDAVESLVVSSHVDKVEQESEAEAKTYQNKHERIIVEQSAKLKGYEVSAAENQRKGELLYEHYEYFSQLLMRAKVAHQKGGWSAVREQGFEVNEQRGVVILIPPLTTR
jgi:predicted ribosome quality control (RQC) complex YloA/Tae2 family protein